MHGRPALALITALALLPAAAPAREQVLIGLADMRGRGTFRSVRKNADGTFVDLTPQGLRAGTAQVEGGTEETRSVFRPTLFPTGQGSYRRSTVTSVSFQMGGGMGTIEQVTSGWGTGSSPQQVFELSTTSVQPANLTTMFQEIVNRGGDGTSIPGFMIKSTESPAKQGPFHVRFAVTVQDAVPWTITGRDTFIGAGAFRRRVLQFRSSRRGIAEMLINQQQVLADVPVAARHTYHFDLVGLAVGANAVLIRITDPGDQSSQEFSLSVNGP